jgi:signal transduction histidine kinase/DNA-binding NarL/FixJ family response regulator/HPt (histidine-containing phosphotransfer) domain-containing protein
VETKKIKKQIQRFFINISMSGKYRGGRKFGMSDYLVRYVLMNFIIIFGVSILVAFAVSNFRLGRYSTAIVCISMIFSAMVSFILARTKIRQYIPALILMIFYGVLCIMVTWIGGAHGANFLFMYMYPSLTIILLGMQSGVILSIILLVLISLEMFVPGVSHFSYPLDFSIRMLVNYSLVFSVMIVIETTRKTKDRLIDEQNRRLEELKTEAEVANRTKSNFLASMSHEIRTPMNAITGMAELLLRRNLADDARGEVQDIKQAATNLISIINDILDFSKIEAGKMEIIPVKYMLSSLVNDTVNIIRMRLTEKPVRFFTNIDGSIPNNLVGDEVRIRQILLNLLSNAAKFTDKGHISLSIIAQKRDSGRVWLEITVTDSGKGMKSEDLEKLFGDFVQVDTKKNRGIEGTGLGLAITKKLCEAMGGSISVESEYGKGSVFKVAIPQGFDSSAAFAAVEEPSLKKVLIYDGRTVYTQSVCWSLHNMGVPYLMTETLEEFSEALLREEWHYVFTGHGLYEKIKSLMDKAVYPSGKKPSLALMVEWENEANIPHVRFISLPVQSLSIANLLNGKADSRDYFSQSSGLIRYTYPRARLLVVDDISTNLKVAEGLLAPYHAKIDTALSGARAIELVKQNAYDIVFMDHMMPEMDGIEATMHIRVWEVEQEKQGIDITAVPVIALTANAVSGMREMFIEKGFSDFLAKPIDISKLDEILARWIPKEKRERKIEKKMENPNNDLQGGIAAPPFSKAAEPSPHSLIPGVDIQKGISMTGGTMAFYREVVGLFRKDAEERLTVLQNAPDTGALPVFITHVHALKSASASIGAAEISAKAAELEAAGKAGNIDLFREKLPGFAEALAELIGGIQSWESEDDTPKGVTDYAVVTRLLHELETALEAENAGDIDRILDELNAQTPSAETKEVFAKISDNVLMTEFENASEIIRSFFKGQA